MSIAVHVAHWHWQQWVIALSWSASLFMSWVKDGEPQDRWDLKRAFSWTLVYAGVYASAGFFA